MGQIHVHRINLMEAFLIETLRGDRVSNTELLDRTYKKEIEEWQSLYPKLDFQGLVTLADKDFEAFKSIIQDGYKIKFVTMNGLKNLLKLRFSITENEYNQSEKGIENVKVNNEQLSWIEQILSGNWRIKETLLEKNEDQGKYINILLAEELGK